MRVSSGLKIPQHLLRMVPIPSVREEKNRVWPNEHTQRRRKQQQQQRKNGKKTTNNSQTLFTHPSHDKGVAPVSQQWYEVMERSWHVSHSMRSKTPKCVADCVADLRLGWRVLALKESYSAYFVSPKNIFRNEETYCLRKHIFDVIQTI